MRKRKYIINLFAVAALLVGCHGPATGATTCQIYMRRFNDGDTAGHAVLFADLPKELSWKEQRKYLRSWTI